MLMTSGMTDGRTTSRSALPALSALDEMIQRRERLAVRRSSRDFSPIATGSSKLAIRDQAREYVVRTGRSPPISGVSPIG
jgi:hypothetical protein